MSFESDFIESEYVGPEEKASKFGRKEKASKPEREEKKILKLEESQSEEIFEGEVNELSHMRKREERLSKPILGQLEKTRLISARAARLQEGYLSKIPIERLKSRELQKIARQELEEKVIPIKIIRTFPDGSYEVWEITDFKYIARD